MPKQTPFLYRRGDALSFRIVVPLMLRPYVGCRELTKSLCTSDKHLALPIALELAANAKRLFYDLRKIMSDNASDEALIIQKLKHEIKMRVELAKVIKREHVREIESEIHTAKLEVKSEAYDAFIKQSQQKHTQPLATAPDAQEFASDSIYVGTKTSQIASKHRLSEIIPIWKIYNNPKSSSVTGFERAVLRFENTYPALYIETTEQIHLAGFVKHLIGKGLSSKTITKEHGMIRTMLTFAVSEGWIKSNPAIGTKLPKASKVKPVRTYEMKEVELIFKSPVFASGWRPKVTIRSTGWGEAVYWVPLILLFTGARLDEICQLTTSRVTVKDGVNVLILDTINDDNTLKTEASKRTVPIHDTLIALGFLEYALKINSGMLFPLLTKNEYGNYGASVGRWWGKYLRVAVGITDKKISPSHSFRHLFITECRRLGFRQDFDYAITGHTYGKTDAHDGYGDYPIEGLHENINKMDFRGLDLSHLPQAKAKAKAK